MEDKLIIMSAEQYFKKFAVEGIGKGADRWMIKRQMVDSMHREIFGLITMRTKKDLNDIEEGDEEARRVARNVIHDATMKWKKLCEMFSKYKETANLIELKDLKIYDEMEDADNDGEEPGSVEDTAESAEEGSTAEAVGGDTEDAGASERAADVDREGTGDASQGEEPEEVTTDSDSREKHAQE